MFDKHTGGIIIETYEKIKNFTHGGTKNMKALIPIAPGFEEVEALTVVDILRRAGVEVVMAGTPASDVTPIEGRNRIMVLADTTLNKAAKDDYDIIILPGGAGGTEVLRNDERVKDLCRKQLHRDGLMAAICAAPVVLADAGLLDGRTVTCHPGVKDKLSGATVIHDRVVIDKNLVTSQSPGTAMEFAFKLVELLYDKEKVEAVNKGVIARL